VVAVATADVVIVKAIVTVNAMVIATAMNNTN
jgi:hypothetical protein